MADHGRRSSITGRKLLCAVQALRANGAAEHGLLCAKIENFLEQHPTGAEMASFLGSVLDPWLAAHEGTPAQSIETCLGNARQAGLPARSL